MATLLQGAGAAGRAPQDDRPTLLCASSFGADGMLRLCGRRLAARGAAPLPSLFWAAGLSFSRAELFLQARFLSPCAVPVANHLATSNYHVGLICQNHPSSSARRVTLSI